MGRVFKCKSRAVFVPRVVRGRFATCSVTNARMQEITGEHSKDITAVLQTLVRDGLLTQQNQRRWASYRVAEDSPQLPDDSPHLAPDSPPKLPPMGRGLPPITGRLPPIGPNGWAFCGASGFAAFG